MSLAAQASSAPVVPGNPILGNILDFRRDRVGFMRRVASDLGDFARARHGVMPLAIVSSPELCHEVLIEKAELFHKGFGLSIFGRPLLGNGLLISEDAFHKRQRRMIAPAFVQKRIAEYAAVISARAGACAASWQDGAVVDASEEMMRFTLEVVGKTLFDAEVGSEAAEIGEALTRAMEHMVTSINRLVPIPPSWPTPKNVEARKFVARLDETVYRMIRERRASGEDHGDFLSMLLAAQDEDDGGTMTDTQVRDEAMNIFLAGHETTANALAWSFYLLAQHPDVRDALERELDKVLGDKRAATLADLPKMPYALAVFKESMRLYPPAYLVTRTAQQDLTIGGHLIKRRNVVIVNITGMHRRKEYFPEPNRFYPERFLPENERSIPRGAYLPFSAGPRVCIGNHFALMEGHLALATMARSARLDTLPGSRRVEAQPLVTLRPKEGMPMRVTKR